MDKVSIITRAFNRLEYTIQCINSVRDNTIYSNYEHIIINNASTDGTKEWLNWVGDNSRKWFPKLKSYHMPSNLGDWGGMIEGMKYISPDSKYIVQLDNDIDIPHSWLTMMVETLEATGVGVVTIKRLGVKQVLVPKNVRNIKIPSGAVLGGNIGISVACYLTRTDSFSAYCNRTLRKSCDGLAKSTGKGCFKITSVRCHQMEGWDGETYDQYNKYPRRRYSRQARRGATQRKVSIVIPVIRPKLAKQCIELIYKNAGVPRSQYEIVTEEDIDRVGVTKMVKRLVARSRYDLVMFIGDDIAPQKDFLKNALIAMGTLPNSWGLVGLNDGVQNGNWLATHWLGDKRMLPLLDGEFFHTGYWHTRCDVELTRRARELGRYVWAKNAIITPVKTPKDPDKGRVYSKEWKRHDRELFSERQQTNWRGVRNMKDTKEVSIIISNRNDVAMLAVTVRSCIEELRPLGKGNGEIIVCDNSDAEIYNRLSSVLPAGYVQDGTLKIIRQDFPCLFTAREAAIEEAEGDYIICLDSHVIVGRNMISDLVNFMFLRRKDKTLGFAHAPISWAHQHERAARHDRDMSTHELGDWGTVYNHERMITWKGMPWICRREWFLDKVRGLGGYGALSEHRLSWGGGDMHIGIKPWLLGFKNWAVPTRPAIHIGPFPKIDAGMNRYAAKVGEDKYRLWSESGEGPHGIGFLVSCYVLGGVPMMERNAAAISERFSGFISVRKEWDRAIELGQNERRWLLNNQVISFEQLLKRRPWGPQSKSPTQEIRKSPVRVFERQEVISGTDWRSRVATEQDRLINEQTGGQA